MKQLKQKRDQALARLHELAPQLLIGSASETYRTCGTPGCRCHSDGPKHGPHLYVNYKGENGRTTGYYVPKALHERVCTGLDAWREFQVLAKRIGQLNQEIMLAERPKKTRRAKKKK
jgi:hypothetical protein